MANGYFRCVLRIRAVKTAARATLLYVLLVHLLVIAAMAVSPALHERIHADADHNDHECAVTLFAHGNCDSSAPPLITAEFVRIEVSDSVLIFSEHVPSCYLASRILEHAPPVNS